MPALAADLEYCPAVNFAVQQSLLTYIQKITIRNLTNSRIDNVWFTLSFEPQFAENISIEIGPVMPGQVIEIDREYIDVKLSFDFLVGLTERIKGYNVIDIYSGETLVYHEKYDAEGFDPYKLRSLSDVKYIPFTTKDSTSCLTNR